MQHYEGLLVYRMRGLANWVGSMGNHVNSMSADSCIKSHTAGELSATVPVALHLVHSTVNTIKLNMAEMYRLVDMFSLVPTSSTSMSDSLEISTPSQLCV